MVNKNGLKRLLMRPVPKKGESAYGWLLRTALENNYSSVRWVMEHYGLIFGAQKSTRILLPDKDSLNQISALTCVDSIVLEDLFWNELLLRSDYPNGESALRSALIRPIQQVCPKCLEQHGYLQKIWELSAIACCPEHGIYLIAKCTCGLPIPMTVSSLEKCVCGRRFYGSRSTHAPQELVEYSTMLSTASSQTRRSLILEHRFLAWYWRQGLPLNGLTQYSRSIIHYHNEAKMVANFMNNREMVFFEIMDRYTESKKRQLKRGFRGELGDVHDSLLRMKKAGSSGVLQELFDQYVYERWPEGGWLANKRKRLNTLISETQVMKVLGIRSIQIRRLVRSAGINAIIKAGGGHKHRYYSEEQIRLLKECINATFSLQEAATELGVSRYIVHKLLIEGVIKGESPRSNNRTRNWVIWRKDLEALWDRLFVDAEKRPSNSYKYIRDVLALYKSIDIRMSRIIRACLDKKIRYHIDGDAESLWELKVDTAQLAVLIDETFERPSESRLINVSRAAKQLRVSPKMIHALVRREELLPYIAPSHHQMPNKLMFTAYELNRFLAMVGSQPRLISLRAAANVLGTDPSHLRKSVLKGGYLWMRRIKSFNSEWHLLDDEVRRYRQMLNKTISGPEMAAILGVTRNTILKWQNKGLLKPVAGPKIDGYGCYRYQKEEINHFRHTRYS